MKQQLKEIILENQQFDPGTIFKREHFQIPLNSENYSILKKVPNSILSFRIKEIQAFLPYKYPYRFKIKLHGQGRLRD
jgi:hypothetical protein